MNKIEKGSKIIGEYFSRFNCNVSIGTVIKYLVNNYAYTQAEAEECCTNYIKNNQLEEYKDPVSIFNKHSE